MNVSTIEKKLKLNSYVDFIINVFIKIDGKIVIYIKEKIPVDRVNNIKKQYYLIFKEEYLLLSKYYSYSCMVVNKLIIKEDIQNIYKLIKKIKSKFLLKKYIIGIKKLNNKSFIFFIYCGGYYIDFGYLSNYNQKLEILTEFYQQDLHQISLNMYDVIILKYDNQIVAVKRKKNE